LIIYYGGKGRGARNFGAKKLDTLMVSARKICIYDCNILIFMVFKVGMIIASKRVKEKRLIYNTQGGMHS
jgi:hypothetical protein